jgi:hypothetical protein
MAEKRQTAVHYAQMVSRLEANEDVNFPDITGGDLNKIDPVAEKYLDRIGLLPGNIPERVTTFYTYLRGIRIDIVNLHKGQFEGHQLQAAIIRADLILWSETVQLGTRLWTDLRNIATRPW